MTTQREILLKLFDGYEFGSEIDADGDISDYIESLGIGFLFDPHGCLLTVNNPYKRSLDSLHEHRSLPHPAGMTSRVAALCEAYGYDTVITCAMQEKAARVAAGLLPADAAGTTRLPTRKENA